MDLLVFVIVSAVSVLAFLLVTLAREFK